MILNYILQPATPILKSHDRFLLFALVVYVLNCVNFIFLVNRPFYSCFLSDLADEWL